jgi:hypothetical protein
LRRATRDLEVKTAFILLSAAFSPLPGANDSVEPSVISATATIYSWADVLRYGVMPGKNSWEVCEASTLASSASDTNDARWMIISDGLTDHVFDLSLEAAPSGRTFHRFLELPKELRLTIRKFALQDQPDEVEIREAVKRGDDSAKLKFLPALCYTSKATFEEAMAVFI